MSTARYTGPVNPLVQQPVLAQAAGSGTVVRGQDNGQSPDPWQNYTPRQPYGQPPTNTGAVSAPPTGYTQPGYVQPPTGYAQPNNAPQPAQPVYNAPYGNNSGYVGGSIPVHGQTQPYPVVQDATTNYQNPGAFGGQMPPPGAILTPNPADFPYADVDVYVDETETGRFMFGVGVNSDAGVSGQIVIDERNFDLFRPPTQFGQILDGTAFRGGGQGLRIEAIPGSQVQRYVVNFTQPYLFNSNVSFNVSGFYFDRRFQDWDEQRIGGRMGLGYRLTPDLSVATSLRGEKVDIHDPRFTGPAYPQLNAAVGDHDLYSGSLTMTYDTRDIPFNPTEGQMLELSVEQAFGSFDFTKAQFDYRKYFLVAERPDGSGRHVLAFQFRGGVTGSQTPVFENFFAGGFSTLRGFSFRGASPVEGVPGAFARVGGELMFLGSVEYRFPLTADDMLHGVAFVDYGTVEQNIELTNDNYRVAPGVGLRIAIPAMGPAPIALDFAFPVASAPTDEEQVFSFFVGFGR